MQQIVVTGDARCLWDDLAQVPASSPVMAVNYSGLHIRRPVAHLASWHADVAGHVAEIRRARIDPLSIAHAPQAYQGVDQVWMFPAGGTSSLFAVRVALALGYDRVILAGVPLDGSGHFYDPPGQTTDGFFSDNTRQWWVDALSMLNGRVVSCSGWTRSLLGGL